MDDPAAELALALYRSHKRADELQHALERMAWEVKSGPAGDLRALTEAERETPRRVLDQLDRLAESTVAAAELLQAGAGRLADAKSWKGADAWSAKLFRRIERVPQALHALRADLAHLAERTDTPDPATPFAFDRIDRTCTETAEWLRELAGHLFDDGDTLYACMATRPPPAEPDAELADARDSGLMVCELAEKLAVDRTTVRGWAKKAEPKIDAKEQGETFTVGELHRLADAAEKVKQAKAQKASQKIRELAKGTGQKSSLTG